MHLDEGCTRFRLQIVIPRFAIAHITLPTLASYKRRALHTHCNTITVYNFAFNITYDAVRIPHLCFASTYHWTVCSVRLTRVVVVLPDFPLTRFSLFRLVAVPTLTRTHTRWWCWLFMCFQTSRRSFPRSQRIHSKITKYSAAACRRTVCYIFPVVSGSRLNSEWWKCPTLPSPSRWHPTSRERKWCCKNPCHIFGLENQQSDVCVTYGCSTWPEPSARPFKLHTKKKTNKIEQANDWFALRASQRQQHPDMMHYNMLALVQLK